MTLEFIEGKEDLKHLAWGQNEFVELDRCEWYRYLEAECVGVNVEEIVKLSVWR